MSPPSAPPFHEAPLARRPLRSLGLALADTPVAAQIAKLEQELVAAGLTRVHPRFYLSTEWGVPFETVAVAIPFYLARPELAELHADQTGMVEGVDPDDVMRYLRHETGHVINYAYQLYQRADWTAAFGGITQPYLEHYRPSPWSTRFVRHLPGWYAQKHPDEDWAETFAVWLTPGRDWRADHAALPGALAKLELCDRLIREVRDRVPPVTDDELDTEISEVDSTAEQLYASTDLPMPALPAAVDGALHAMFGSTGTAPASGFVRAQIRAIARATYTWTGHFPEHTRELMLHLARRADQLGLRVAPDREAGLVVELTAFVVSLAANHVHRGAYVP